MSLLNSSEYYQYATYSISPKVIARYYIKEACLVVYYYAEELEIDLELQRYCSKNSCGILPPRLEKVLVFDVTVLKEKKYVISLSKTPTENVNKEIYFATEAGYEVYQIHYSEAGEEFPPYPRDYGTSSLIYLPLDSHWVVSQYSLGERKRSVMDKVLLLMRNKATGYFCQFLVKERNPIKMHVYRPSTVETSPSPLLPLELPTKFQLRCTATVTASPHPMYMKLPNTHRCRILDCACSNLGQTATCESCNCLYHSCIYTGCRAVVKCSLSVYRGLNEDLVLSARIQAVLMKHYNTAHPMPTITKAGKVKRDLTIVPDEILPLREDNSFLGEALKKLRVDKV
jgi:hypothetical protein